MSMRVQQWRGLPKHQGIPIMDANKFDVGAPVRRGGKLQQNLIHYFSQHFFTFQQHDYHNSFAPTPLLL